MGLVLHVCRSGCRCEPNLAGIPGSSKDLRQAQLTAGRTFDMDSSGGGGSGGGGSGPYILAPAPGQLGGGTSSAVAITPRGSVVLGLDALGPVYGSGGGTQQMQHPQQQQQGAAGAAGQLPPAFPAFGSPNQPLPSWAGSGSGHLPQQQAASFPASSTLNARTAARLRVRMLPYLASRLTQDYSMPKCNFRIRRAKLSAARVVVNREMGVAGAYTLEASLGGSSATRTHFGVRDYVALGHNLCRCACCWRC